MVVTVVAEFSKNKFLHALPNTKNTLPANFPKHKQTTKNIFLFVKYFYIWKTFYILPNTT